MSCPRIIEVEAARDGRLADRSSLDRHVQTCAACRAHLERLETVARALCDLPALPEDELAAQRARNRLLEAFDTSPQPRARHRVRRIAVGAAMAVAVGLAAVYLATSRTGVATPAASVRDPIQIEAERARWSRVDDGSTTTVRLDDGDVRVHVDHRAASRRLVVIVPDGHLEDLGTTFSVRVRAGRTTEIVVEEGRVSFRRGHDAALLLTAGEHWVARDSLAASAAPPSTALAPVAPPRPVSTATSMPRPPRKSPASPLSDDSQFERELREALATLDAGQPAAAATALADIVARYADDPRAEDAAYLLVIARQRASDPDGARNAARDYMRRFPNGFRRAAVAPLAHPP